MKVLFIEDEPVLADDMLEYFSSQGMLCESARTFTAASEKIMNYAYDIIIVDIGLPDGSGMKLIPSVVTQNQDTGIMIVSAKASLPDKLEGLRLGADDYVTKPFYIEELNARMHALYRRKALKGTHRIVFDDFSIEPELKVLYHQNTEISLTKKEYQLLLYFIVNKERVVSKAAIAEHVWGDYADQLDNFDAIYVHLMNLRKKLSKASGGKEYISTVYGMGYKFNS
ncbi:DNA-binding response regulator [Mucilaginibacter conchicola]|uniref:DNA-binding response regulator n=1 Tax=Mucilaginibacter conchicola TaxID=2303333 RepID=A0A372NLX5_9SPHI|nr:response regulator transcription factor [Mucilaginibacter conchicola]RFZ89966.1 DNA-binding response regulator [Mucilaginibacter conchicola]